MACCPYDGVFGNPAGCHLYATGEMLGDGYLLLTADTFTSKKIGCDFETLASNERRRSLLSMRCAVPGANGR